MEIKKINYEQAKILCENIEDYNQNEILDKWIKRGLVEEKQLTAKEKFKKFEPEYLGAKHTKYGEEKIQDIIYLKDFIELKNIGLKAIEESEQILKKMELNK